MTPWVLGINGSHNGSYCLLHGDQVRVAVQEERLVGLKHARVSGARPALALRYCLDTAGIDVGDLAMVVISSQGPAGAVENDLTLNPDFRAIRHVPVRVVPHHLAHAASALATSGFDRAAVLVVDGLGSPVADIGPSAHGHIVGPAGGGWEHASLFAAHGSTIRLVQVHTVADGRWLHKHPDGMWGYSSLGGMFSSIAHQIFGDETTAGEVMGLAAYGEPTIPATEFVDFDGDALVFPNLVQRRFPFTERWPAHEDRYAMLAASGQAALDGAVLRLANRLRELTGEQRLCYAGGVALNSVANEAIRRAAGFRDVHVVPAAEDSGVALGAAYLGCWELTGRRCGPAIRTDAHGAVYPATASDRAIAATPATVVHAPGDLLDEVAGRLVRGEIGAWFQGGSELGPRALGHRSIVCSPIGADVKAALNARVKFRQMFRPFAPAVLREEADHWFDFGGTPHDSPFMFRVVPFRPDRRDLVPAVVHHDGTGRLQTLTREDDGSFYDLVALFGQRTGVPILLNTSLNVRGEPIAERPEDALWCLLGTGLDFCVLGDRLVTKLDTFGSVLDLVPRVVAEGCTVALSIGDGAVAFRADGEQGVVVRTATPWGPADVPLSPHLFALLANVDGRRSGHELHGSLSGAPPVQDVARDLLLLRRMGAIVLTPGPPP